MSLSYKDFIFRYIKKHNKTPNQLEIEALYKSYLDNKDVDFKIDNKVNIVNIDKIDIDNITSLNQEIKSNNYNRVLKAISLKLPYSEYTIYFAIKSNNFSLFKIVADYVQKITSDDLNIANLTGNIEIINFIKNKLSNTKINVSNTNINNTINNVNISNNIALINSINGLTNSKGGLNLSQFQKELINFYPQYKLNILKMKRNELELFCKNYLKIIQ